MNLPIKTCVMLRGKSEKKMISQTENKPESERVIDHCFGNIISIHVPRAQGVCMVHIKFTALSTIF